MQGVFPSSFGHKLIKLYSTGCFKSADHTTLPGLLRQLLIEIDSVPVSLQTGIISVQ